MHRLAVQRAQLALERAWADWRACVGWLWSVCASQTGVQRAWADWRACEGWLWSVCASQTGLQ